MVAPVRAAAYTGLGPLLGVVGQQDPSWEKVGTEVYLPYVYRHAAWQYTTRINMVNTGPAPTNVYLTYYHQDGTVAYDTGAIPIASNGSYGTKPTTDQVGNAFFGSARIWSDSQPVAVTADALQDNALVDFNNTALSGAPTVYVPYLMKQYANWNSCVTVRNVSAAASNTVNITYFWTGGSRTEQYTIPAKGMQCLCQGTNGALPSLPLSAKIQSVSNLALPIAVAATLDNASLGQDMSYNGVGQPSQTVIVPYLAKTTDWSSGYSVQNAGSSTTCPSVTYYSTNGVQVLTTALPCLAAGQGVNVYVPGVSGLPTPFEGSAVVSAAQPLAAMANAICVSSACSSGDTVYAYNSLNR